MNIVNYLYACKFIVASLLALLINNNAFSQNQGITSLDGTNFSSQKLTSEIEKIMESENIPAISIAFINDNKMVYHKALGVSDIEAKESVSDQSIFEAASLSKPIFAYFVMKMVEKGVIDLDKPLFEYLPHPGIAPESQEDAKLITARMVLAHQTGFPNHSNGELIKLAFKPGTDFMYSGEAYQYLAAIIGMQNGIGYKADLNELFQNEVTGPLKMSHSTFVWDDYLTTHKVFGHNNDGKPTDDSPRVGSGDGTTFFAYASLHSEANEYAKFILAMLKREGLKSETFDKMLEEHTHFKDDNPLKQEIGQTGWGLGFAQKRTAGYTMHMHTGNNHDFQAYAMFVPEKKYGIVVFTNCDKMKSFLERLSSVFGPQF
jgi:CubicO group peptidase (beta-lactamase class C family)